MSIQPVPLVERLAALYGQILQCRRDALGYAREAGDLLRTVSPRDRAALARDAGIDGRSTRFVYVQISENWEAVQHAGSIRQALKIINATRRPGPNVPLPFADRCLIAEKHEQTEWCVDDVLQESKPGGGR